MFGSSHRAGQRQPCQDLGLALPSVNLAALHTSQQIQVTASRGKSSGFPSPQLRPGQAGRGGRTGRTGREADTGGPGEVSLYLEGPGDPEGSLSTRAWGWPAGTAMARGSWLGVHLRTGSRTHRTGTPSSRHAAGSASSCRLSPALSWGRLCDAPLCSPSRKPRLPRHVQELRLPRSGVVGTLAKAPSSVPPVPGEGGSMPPPGLCTPTHVHACTCPSPLHAAVPTAQTKAWGGHPHAGMGHGSWGPTSLSVLVWRGSSSPVRVWPFSEV